MYLIVVCYVCNNSLNSPIASGEDSWNQNIYTTLTFVDILVLRVKGKISTNFFWIVTRDAIKIIYYIEKAVKML